MIMDRERGTPKGIGFVEYATAAEMKAALGEFMSILALCQP